MARKKKLVVRSNDPRPSDSKVILELIQYDEKEYSMYQDLPITELIAHIKLNHVNWINLDGLHEKSIVQKLADHFCLHSLLVEDITSDHQPKAEEYDDFLFLTLKMLYRIDEGKIDYEQISFVLGKDYLLSFQEKEGDLFGLLRDRIRLDQGRVRKKKADYLLYRVVDIIVDNYYNVLDAIGEQIETIEDEIYKNSTETQFKNIQQLKKELIFLRKALYPLRDAMSKILKDESGFIDPVNLRYYADVYDHVVHLIDSLDTYKDLTSGLMDIYINTLNTRMNEVIKVLTVISTIFMPLTFIVGVYGMNFHTDKSVWNMPELDSPYGYPIVMGFMLLIVIAMIRYFKFKKWF
ncbi:MAG: magnesium/cobalt transporter CorA [Cytophagales bacterium]|jgi:magnesium transporter|nr:magnesium/cobalt transporter CorA [Cytophagales bacterium]MCA6368417.1 magnesium/cobalt transporter CorA [Cytophagales bacterium]MCA6371576.1 magnesium/cobalt transporter CorA [Cytophagales bacterium]MCA6377496.1 magnesium/cobalt transporter CorA [Cytophagales bacterium]MCA6385971.1 magnesium/cobalt transporter CorA [Cytophagales bacterium]